jgi:hypothetical protein
MYTDAFVYVCAAIAIAGGKMDLVLEMGRGGAERNKTLTTANDFY